MWSLILLGITGLIGASGVSADKIVSSYVDESKNDGVPARMTRSDGEGVFSDITTLPNPPAQTGEINPFDDPSDRVIRAGAVGLSALPTRPTESSGRAGQAGAVPDLGTVTESDLTAAAMPFTVTIPVADGTIRYRVQRGDTLAALAARFGITPETIRWANLSVGRTIRPGAELTILPVSGVRYAVIAGDSLTTIAARYGIDPETIRQFNPRYQEILMEGSGLLMLPGAKPIAVVKGKK
ncbi:MAG: LysM peptidoglycan-binding domain-containing protein [bacterium]|nr:LysM peptidoglycan-binding domain-containing protein [bacterium]